MAKGKYEKQAPTRTIKTYKKYTNQPHSKVQTQGKYLQKNSPPKYKISPKTSRRIMALLAAAWIAKSATGINHKTPSQLEEKAPPVETVAVQEYVPEASTEPEKFYTIGIANYDAEITVNGKNYPIGNSFVIASDDEIVVSDVHGNFLKGNLSPDSFETYAQISEKQMSSYNFYQVISDSDANVRSSGKIENDNIISTVSSGDYVLASRAHTTEYDGEWLSTVCISDGKIYTGYMREDIIKEIGTVDAVNYRAEQNLQNINVIAMVDTSQEDYISLKLREEPGQEIITQIPYGSFVEILGDVKQYAGKSWNYVKYKLPDGSFKLGWVATKYLTYDVVQEKPEAKVINGIHINTSGSVTGIDISTLSPNVLRDVLQTGLSKQSSSVHGTFNTSQFGEKINYVYIKLGASSYGDGDFSIIDYDNYIQQVAICEELGIPYGFYYYSTAINQEEANMELNCIKDRMEDLRQRYDMKNNLLEIAVDIELTDMNDRQYQGDIYEQTEAKATLINGIQEQNLSENVLIYGPGRVMQPNLDQIFDLEYLNSLLETPENVALWHCSLMDRNGELKSSLKSDIDYAKQCGFSTVSFQSALDIYVKSNGKVTGLIDINQMDFNHFNKLTKNKTSYTLNNSHYEEDLEL